MIGMEGVLGLAVGLGERLLDNLMHPYVNAWQEKAALKRLSAMVL